MNSKRYGNFVRFDEMTWPLIPTDLEWVLRYGVPTKENLLMAASILNAYRASLHLSQKRRNQIFNRLVVHYKELYENQQ